MKIVIDVGCARYGGDYSIERLIEAFDPDILYGFDPAWTTTMIEVDPGMKVIISNAAAWIYDGEVRFLADGLSGKVGDHAHWPLVGCIDLARFIRQFPDGDEVILKMDCEGSEYPLLDHLIAKGVDERLSLLWIEWHTFGAPKARRSLERRLRCPVEEWNH